MRKSCNCLEQCCAASVWIHITRNEMQLVLTWPLPRGKCEGLRNTVGRINAIMCEAAGNCLRPEIPYPTLLKTADFQTWWEQ